MSVAETISVPLATLPETRAAAQPDAPATADDAVALDNAAFADRVARAPALLARLGVGAGDVVAVAIPNRVELIIALFAAWRLGAAATPVNPALTAAEMQYQVDDARAKVVIGEGEVDALAAESARHTEPAAVAPDALALLIYTSGTTSKPKGVMLDHANLAAMTEMTRAGLGMTAADHSLLILPLFHVNGIVVGTLSPCSRAAAGPSPAASVPRRSSGRSSGSGRRTSRPYRPSTRCSPRCPRRRPRTPPRCGSWAAAPRRRRRGGSAA